VLALPLAVFAAGAWAAFAVSARRDLGAGLLSDRPGRPVASAFLRWPFSLAWRLQRMALAWWALGFVFIFGVSGAAGSGIAKLAASSGALKNEFARLGGQSAIADAYLASLMLLAGIAAAAYGVATVGRLRSEETGSLAEPLLAGATGRLRWGLSHLVVAVAGTAVLLAAGGLAAGLGYGLAASGSGGSTAGGPGSGAGASGMTAGGVTVGGAVGRELGAGVAQLPAACVIIGVAVLAFGLLPRASAAIGWSAFGLALAVNLFGQSLQLSHWVLDVSPFTHSPRLPGSPLTAAPLLWLSIVAVALAGVGLGGLRRRDIG
jgi:ABC-2 type transport system permease protein